MLRIFTDFIDFIERYHLLAASGDVGKCHGTGKKCKITRIIFDKWLKRLSFGVANLKKREFEIYLSVCDHKLPLMTS